MPTSSILHDQQEDFYYRAWQCVSPAVVLLLVHGLGAHSARWEETAEYLCARKISCFAIELPGFGETPPPRGDVKSLSEYARVLKCLHAVAVRVHPDVPVIVCGESMGALLAITHAAGHLSGVRAVALIAPAFRSLLRWGIGARMRYALAALVYPRLRVCVPIAAEMISRDCAVQQRLHDDWREQRCVSARLLVSVFFLQRRAATVVRTLALPLYCVIPLGDEVVDSVYSLQVLGGRQSLPTQVNQYPVMHHVPFMDIGKEKVWDDLAQWVIAQAKER